MYFILWYIGKEMPSCWWIAFRWLHQMLSFGQLPVQPVTKISSTWWHLHCSVWPHYEDWKEDLKWDIAVHSVTCCLLIKNKQLCHTSLRWIIVLKKNQHCICWWSGGNIQISVLIGWWDCIVMIALHCVQFSNFVLNYVILSCWWNGWAGMICMCMCMCMCICICICTWPKRGHHCACWWIR